MSAPRPHDGILAITPYVGGRASVPGVAKVHKLASNESPLGPSPAAAAAVRDAAAGLALYPDGSAGQLRAAIGAAHRIDPARIVCGNGSDELLHLIAQAYCRPDDEVIHTEHGFLVYPIAARAAGAVPVAVPERDLTADVDAILAHVTDRTRIVFLANPNNPTGSYIPGTELRRLRAGLREDVLLVIDGAYSDYVDAPDYEDGLAMVDGAANVVVTRTFSKIYGLAGLRVGWAYCPADVAGALNRARGPFNVNSAGLAGALAGVEDRAHVAAAKAHNDRWLPRLTGALGQMGLKVYPSVCNFVLIGFPDEDGRRAGDADRFLSARGLILRAVGAYGLPHCLRLSIGSDEANEAVIAALGAFMDAGR